jgi:hypothetical protein
MVGGISARVAPVGKVDPSAPSQSPSEQERAAPGRQIGPADPANPVDARRRASLERERVLNTAGTPMSAQTARQTVADAGPGNTETLPAPTRTTGRPLTSKHTPDRFASFQALLDAGEHEEGRDYLVTALHRGSRVSVIAPHAGYIELGTGQIMRAIAGEDLSAYAFETTIVPNYPDLHITSNRFDEPRCLALISTSITALTIHGAAGRQEITWIGGLDTDTGQRIADAQPYWIGMFP